MHQPFATSKSILETIMFAIIQKKTLHLAFTTIHISCNLSVSIIKTKNVLSGNTIFHKGRGVCIRRRKRGGAASPGQPASTCTPRAPRIAVMRRRRGRRRRGSACPPVTSRRRHSGPGLASPAASKAGLLCSSAGPFFSVCFCFPIF